MPIPDMPIIDQMITLEVIIDQMIRHFQMLYDVRISMCMCDNDGITVNWNNVKSI